MYLCVATFAYLWLLYRSVLISMSKIVCVCVFVYVCVRCQFWLMLHCKCLFLCLNSICFPCVHADALTHTHTQHTYTHKHAHTRAHIHTHNHTNAQSHKCSVYPHCNRVKFCSLVLCISSRKLVHNLADLLAIQGARAEVHEQMDERMDM